jgi:hypothetical protein
MRLFSQHRALPSIEFVDDSSPAVDCHHYASRTVHVATTYNAAINEQAAAGVYFLSIVRSYKFTSHCLLSSPSTFPKHPSRTPKLDLKSFSRHTGLFSLTRRSTNSPPVQSVVTQVHKYCCSNPWYYPTTKRPRLR